MLRSPTTLNRQGVPSGGDDKQMVEWLKSASTPPSDTLDTQKII